MKQKSHVDNSGAGAGGGGGGVILRILGGGVPSISPNPFPISDKKCHFSHRFYTWPLRNYVIITKNRTSTNGNDKYVHTLP